MWNPIQKIIYTSWWFFHIYMSTYWRRKPENFSFLVVTSFFWDGQTHIFLVDIPPFPTMIGGEVFSFCWSNPFLKVKNNDFVCSKLRFAGFNPKLSKCKPTFFPKIYQKLESSWTFSPFGGFHTWGYPKHDGLQRKMLFEWVIRGYPIYGTPHLWHGQ